MHTIEGARYTFAHAVLFLLVRHDEGNWRDQMWTVFRNSNRSWELDLLSPAIKLLRTDPDVDRILPMFADIGSERIADLIFDRMGRGGDDEALMGQVRHVFRETEAMLDAALRMHERGDCEDLLDIRSILSGAYLTRLAVTRPDLVKRARYAAQEQGWFDEVAWP
jgi:hypothetical protein